MPALLLLRFMATPSCHCCQTGAGHLGEGSKDLVKGVVGGAASSASKMTDALDNFVRGAGGIEGETPSGMEASKVIGGGDNWGLEERSAFQFC